MPSRALIVVDIQNDYFPGGRWPLQGMEEAADNAVRLIAATREAGEPVIFIRHEFDTADAPFFSPGSPGAQIHAKLPNQHGDTVLLKYAVNAFQDTGLRALLDGQQIEAVTICGAMSHMCIDATTRAAGDFGYEVTVVHDACATRDLDFNGTTVPAAQVHAAFMSALAFGYATVLSTDAYLGAGGQVEAA